MKDLQTHSLLVFQTEGYAFGGTYFGTASYDQAYFIQLDEDDLIYIYGQTTGDMDVEGITFTMRLQMLVNSWLVLTFNFKILNGAQG